MRTVWTPRDDVRSIRGALRVVGPGAVGAVGALAAWLLVVQEFEAPYLGNLIVDASSSVLSPSGFTVVLDIVGQAGKAVTLATTIALQFVVFVLLWAWGTQYLEPRDGLRQRWRFAAIQLGMAFALFVILAAIFDLAAVSSVFSTGDWLQLPLADRGLHGAVHRGRARHRPARRAGPEDGRAGRAGRGTAGRCD